MLEGEARTFEGFCDYLIENGLVSAEAIQRLKAAIRTTGQSPDVIIVELALLREDDLQKHLACYCRVPLFSPPADEAHVGLLHELGVEFAIDKALLPVELADGKLVLAVANPFDRETFDAVGYFFDAETELQIAPRSVLLEIASKASESMPLSEVGTQTGEDGGTLEEDVDRLQDIALSAPVVNLVNRLTQQALDQNASDIHIEPMADKVQIRMRRDGILVPFDTVPKSMLPGLVSRIKILSKLNIVERRIPQDGRMRLPIRGQEVDFRISVVPSAHGETIVMRLLHNKGMALDLELLGYEDEARGRLERLIHHPNGIVIVTGPTGSGKTTTLYSLVSILNQPETKIFTVEDPIEYRIEGITQVQVNSALGLDFAHALRALLRQDPDVILIGEIRDRETAQIAVQAALTGHLVLATLHTNSAVSALTRLRDMGIEPFLIAATIRGVVGQRLVRTLCQSCGGQGGTHCHECKGSGYSGRSVVYEILEVTPEIATMISELKQEDAVLNEARRHGMETMAEHGRKLIAERKTSPQEIARVVS